MQKENLSLTIEVHKNKKNLHLDRPTECTLNNYGVDIKIKLASN